MATSYSKPTVRASWAQTAGGADFQDPGDTYASAGCPGQSSEGSISIGY